MNTIPNELSARFGEIEVRRQLMREYGNSTADFIGKNEDGEMVMMAIYTDKIIVTTYQNNHWIRKDYYDSEGFYEAEMYDYICDFLNENNLKSKYIFYKPWEFGSSIYENDYLEDGIIYDKENDEIYYLEVFGMNTPTYLKTKAHKEKLADEKLIKWNAYINEGKPNLNIFLNQIK